MPPITKNLGLVQAISVGLNPPTNIKMIWYNTNPGINKHYYYDTTLLTWKTIGSNEISSAIPFKQLSGQMNGMTNVFTLWQNDINLSSQPTIVKDDVGSQRIQTATGIIVGASDFPVNYRSLEGFGSKTDGISPVIVIPDLISNTINTFPFLILDAQTYEPTDDFIITVSVKTYPVPPETPPEES